MSQANLIVVDEPSRWPLQIEGVELVSSRSYLTESRFTELRGARVFNLCRSYRYQSLGYYVSLLAAARGHRPQPSVSAVQDLKSPTIVRAVSEELEDLIQKSLSPLHSDEFVLSIYFGRNLAKRYDRLCRYLFQQFQAPFLRATFIKNARSGKWSMQNIRPVAGSDLSEEHREFVVEVAREYFQGKRRRPGKKTAYRYDLAILSDPQAVDAPSNEKALLRFVKAAESLGFSTEMITREDFGRLAEFDALFIRETTSVQHHTYRFARKAQAEGLVVVDDPESILRCTNKVFLSELLDRHRIAAPRTLILHRGNRESAGQVLGLPCILKQPDSSFSQGVVKVATNEELQQEMKLLLEKSDLIIGQEFMPTEFDWRIGIFDRKPLYACKYFMVKKHWQILRRDGRGGREEGNFETLPLWQVPPEVIKTALKAANLIGDGLYGVDLKQLGSKVVIIEVNDNPNIDGGVEDRVLGDELYRSIMETMLERVEKKKGRTP